MSKENRKIKILFIAPHRPQRSPSQRFRMEAYFPFLEEAGFEIDYSWIFSEGDDRVLYVQGNYLRKGWTFLKGIFIRLNDVLRAKKFDIIFIHREAFMTGSVFFEKKFRESGAKIVFDFDDAIWLADTSAANAGLQWLKRPMKTGDIIQLSDLVIAGNAYLANFAATYNKNVMIIPTSVNTDVYIPSENKTLQEAVTIGWSGSNTTMRHFSLIKNTLRRLKEVYTEKVSILVISNIRPEENDLPVEFIEWNEAEEVKQLNKIDIGIMPLPDEEWSKGKCALKALLYMSLKIPPVISPTGMNKELIQQGVNGFLAATENDWLNCLKKLIDSQELRIRLGEEALKTVEFGFALQKSAPHLIGALRNLVG